MRRVKITTHEVGQRFGCEACVRDLQRHKLHTTRVFPYGQNANAYQTAAAECERRGWRVVEGE